MARSIRPSVTLLHPTQRLEVFGNIFASSNYTVSEKVSPLMYMYDNNLGKCGPITTILSPYDSSENSLRTHTNFHLTCDMLLHYLVKVENATMLLILTASLTNC